jgi:uncharacterized protein (DUF1778 family)
MTLTLELSEEQERVIREAAAAQQTSPEAMVTSLVARFADSQVDNEEARRERVRVAGEYVQQKNTELYERLA